MDKMVRARWRQQRQTERWFEVCVCALVLTSVAVSDDVIKTQCLIAANAVTFADWYMSLLLDYDYYYFMHAELQNCMLRAVSALTSEEESDCRHVQVTHIRLVPLFIIIIIGRIQHEHTHTRWSPRLQIHEVVIIFRSRTRALALKHITNEWIILCWPMADGKRVRALARF